MSVPGPPARCRTPAAAFAAAVAGLALAAVPAHGQEAGGASPDTATPPMVTDRPDFTESAAAVRRVQLEAGWTVEAADGADAHTVGEALLRIPAARGLELRVGLPSWRADGSVPTEDAFGDASVGAKLELARGGADGGGPDLALLAGASFPVGDRGSEGPAPEARLAAAVPLGPRLGLGLNLGAASPEDAAGRFVEAVGSVALGVDAGGGVGLFAELYGLGRSEGRDDEIVADGGFTFALSSDLQLDARIGVPLDGGGRDLEAGAGLSVRF